MSNKMENFFQMWTDFIDKKIETQKQKRQCQQLFAELSAQEMNVEELKESLNAFMHYEFTLGSKVCDWREPIPPYDLFGWLFILGKCPHLDKNFTTEMFLDGQYPETVENPLKSQPCGCLSKGSCSSHLKILAFIFNHTEITWQDLDKESIFFTAEEIAERDEADRKALTQENDQESEEED